MRKMLLESSGFKAVTATTGEEGLRVFKAQPVDAAIVDYAMPGMDGAAVSAQIKQAKPQTPVIMLSGYSSVRPIVSQVVDAFVIKGDSPEALLRRVESLVKIRSHSHPELAAEYVIFSDRDRRYLDCSDGVCRLLGYSRAEILDMTIDDLSYDPDPVTDLFERFRIQRAQEGSFLLRDAKGRPVPIRYESFAFPDGCMAAVWQPATESNKRPRPESSAKQPDSLHRKAH